MYLTRRLQLQLAQIFVSDGLPGNVRLVVSGWMSTKN